MKAVFNFDQGALQQGVVEVSHSPEDEEAPYVFLKTENPRGVYTCLHLDPDDARLIANALARAAGVVDP